ncbi:uncharacterized protein LOC144825047 [Lissotriton helveticus]
MLLNRGIYRDSWHQDSSGGSDDYSGHPRGPGSPRAGEAASPQSSTTRSPSSPASGQTEESNIGTSGTTHCKKKPRHSDPTSCNSRSPKKYVGVRVRMPVKEILKKIRIGTAQASGDKQDTALQGELNAVTKKGRVHPYSAKRHKHNKSREDFRVRKIVDEELDALYEILQKDLKQKPHGAATPALNSCCKEEGGGTLNDLLDVVESCVDKHRCYTKHGSPPDSHAQPHGETPECLRAQAQQPGSPSFTRIQEAFSKYYSDDARVDIPDVDNHSPSSQCSGGHYDPVQNCPALVTSPNLSSEQDHCAFSVFQFQILQEELRLHTLPLEVLFALDENGNGLIHNAVINGRRALVFALARQLAAFNIIDMKDAMNKTALHLAAERNQHLMVRDLLSLGANGNEADHSGKTALHICAEHGYWGVLEIFRKSQDEGLHFQVDAIDHNGLTPLQYAVRGQYEAVKELQRNDLTIDTQKLLLLKKDRLSEAVNCLLSMGADPLTEYFAFCSLLHPMDDINTQVLLEDTTDLSVWFPSL